MELKIEESSEKAKSISNITKLQMKPDQIKLEKRKRRHEKANINEWHIEKNIFV